MNLERLDEFAREMSVVGTSRTQEETRKEMNFPYVQMKTLEHSPPYTGTQINYHFVCKRKLWLFSHNIEMEHASDAVLLGKLIDESTYERKQKGYDIDGTILIDWIDSNTGVIHEVKKSDSMEEAHRWQVLYYLWYLKRKGVTHITGEIDYPKLGQKVHVCLTPELEQQLMDILKQIETDFRQDYPPERRKRSFCKTCSYYELCWVNQ
jgi:CRISPR-associated exonuclease Cas4